jgi:hypothetical protein
MFETKLRTFAFLNETGETVPPFACMITSEVTGTSSKEAATNRDGDLVLKIRKATSQDAADQNAGRVVFNCETPVPTGGYGRCTLSFPAIALVDDGAAVVGGTVGPKTASWAMAGTGSAFTLITADPTQSYFESSSIRSWLVRPRGSSSALAIVGKTTSAGVTGRVGNNVGTGTVEAYEVVAGVLTATGDNYAVKNLSVAAIAGSVWVQAKRELYKDHWFIDWEDCGA